MRLVQVISDYIRESLFTTVGDMIVRGAGGPERLAAGVIGTILKGKGGATLPAFEVPNLSENGMYAASFVVSASTTYTVSGLLFQPSLVIFLTRDAISGNVNISIGLDDGTNQALVAITDDAGAVAGSLVSTIRIKRNAGNYIIGNITSITSDGFVVTCTLTGVCSGVVYYFTIG